jgi:hypothetical protein
MQLVVGGKVCKRPKLLADNNCQCLPSSHEKALVVRLENELKLQTKDWAGWLAGSGVVGRMLLLLLLLLLVPLLLLLYHWFGGWLTIKAYVYISTTTLESESNLLSYLWRILHLWIRKVSVFSSSLLALPTKALGKDIVFRFILEYSS